MHKIRLFENFHVVLWLVKDTCWLLHLKFLGTFMAFPTLSLAIWLAWCTRKSKHFFLPNLSVCCWISANVTWMLGEFYGWNLKLPACVFFLSGILVILLYFTAFWRKSKKA